MSVQLYKNPEIFYFFFNTADLHLLVAGSLKLEHNAPNLICATLSHKFNKLKKLPHKV